MPKVTRWPGLRSGSSSAGRRRSKDRLCPKRAMASCCDRHSRSRPTRRPAAVPPLRFSYCSVVPRAADISAAIEARLLPDSVTLGTTARPDIRRADEQMGSFTPKARYSRCEQTYKPAPALAIRVSLIPPSGRPAGIGECADGSRRGISAQVQPRLNGPEREWAPTRDLGPPIAGKKRRPPGRGRPPQVGLEGQAGVRTSKALGVG
jgi:hypothetical protein